MDYDLNQEQTMLADAARRFISSECNGVYLREMLGDQRGCTDQVWGQMAELGWMGLLIPEEWGGYDGSFGDMAVLLYEMGHGCMPGPFFSTAVVGVLTLLAAGSDEQKKAILGNVATGEHLLSLAWLEESGKYGASSINLAATAQGEQYVLSGSKLFVPDALAADTIICATRTNDQTTDPQDGISLFLIDPQTPGLTIRAMKSYTGEKLCCLNFDGVQVGAANLLGAKDQAWPVLMEVLLKAAVAKSAEMSGGADWVLATAVDYAKEREQFGRLIGSFQAIQHHCVNMLTDADTARFLMYQAAWMISAGMDFAKQASMCKAWVGDAYRRLLTLGAQVLGGTGFMEEHDLHLYYNRSKAAEMAYGDARFHRELVAEKMDL